MNPFRFERIWLFLPLLIFFVYGPQSVIGFYYLGGSAATYVFAILIVGALSYSLTYLVLSNTKIEDSFLLRFRYDLSVNTLTLILHIVSVVYFVLILYIALSAEKIALWEALTGKATRTEIIEAREMFFRNREGLARALPYVFTLFTSVLMPYFLALGFINKARLAWPIMFFFMLSLVLSMEKALILKAIFPIFMLAANGYHKKKFISLSLILIIAILLGTAYISRGKEERLSSSNTSTPSTSFTVAELNSPVNVFQGGQELTLGQHIHKYYPLRGNSFVGELVNRSLWIPYVTAFDWVQYFQEKRNSEYLYGTTSTFISKLKGESRFPMESTIFQYQFGAYGTKSATANTNYMIDAFINFGWIGVIFISSFIAVCLIIVKRINNPAAFACMYFFIFQLVGGGFLGTFLGGGLAFFLALVYFFRPKFSTDNALGIRQ
jgi:hypothetical protein